MCSLKSREEGILIQYVRQGGHLVLGQRSAMKDEDNGLQPQRQPGPLAELLGGRVEQYYALIDPVAIEGKFGSGQSKLWAELLIANDKDTEVLETYGKSNGWARREAGGYHPQSRQRPDHLHRRLARWPRHDHSHEMDG